MDFDTLYMFGAGLVGGGAAWGGITVTVRSLKESVQQVRTTQAEVKAELVSHVKADTELQLDLVTRLSRIEGKLDAVVQKTT